MRLIRARGALLAAWIAVGAATGAAAEALAVDVPTSAASSASAPGCPAEPAPLTADEVAAGMRDAVDEGYLWKATKDGRTAWLYGTIHIAQREWMFPGPRVLAALRASDTVALELDPTDAGVVARLQRAIARKPGAPELPAALATRLRVQMAAACIDPATLAGLRPEMRAVAVEVMAGRRLGLHPAYGIDMMLAQVARQGRKPIRSLETPEAQAALLVSDDPKEMARNVADLLDELEAGSSSRILGRLASDWRRGDLEDLAAYGDWCDCLKTPEQRAYLARLVDARNPPMAARIVQWHAEGRSLFVAVGSLHMTGSVGLPTLLRDKGFDVQRVN